MSAALLSCEHLVLMRQGETISLPLCFQLTQGQVLHVTGANGSGKTTLLETLATLITPSQGQMRWQGQLLTSLGDGVRANWHYCAHNDALKKEWTLLEHLQWQQRLFAQVVAPAVLQKALTHMRLTQYLLLPLRQLSKGQQRRAALLVLTLFPRALWLLDEPFSALDTQGAQALVQWMDCHCAQGGSVIFTTHQPYPALSKQVDTLSLDSYRL
nr:heme ABC exporter ATP-binding protein CcmA [Paenalcaligenes hominis]